MVSFVNQYFHRLESHFFSDFFSKSPKESVLEINEKFDAKLFNGILKCFYGKI